MTTTEHHRLGRWIAVYRDTADAQAAVDDVDEVEHGQAVVEIEPPGAADESLRAEMQAEVDDAWASPGIGVFLAAHQMRGAILFAALCGAVGTVLGLPIGLLLYGHSGELWVQLGIGALVGFLFGSVVGALLGGGFAMQSPAHQPAAQRGIVVTVSPALPEAREALARHDPIRIDRIADAERVETPVTEQPSGLRETIEEFTANAADPERQG